MVDKSSSSYQCLSLFLVNLCAWESVALRRPGEAELLPALTGACCPGTAQKWHAACWSVVFPRAGVGDPPAPQPRAVHLASWCCRGSQPPGSCSSLTPMCPRHAASVCSYHSCLIASRECTKPISFVNICVEGFVGTWALRLLFCSLPCASSLFAMGMICSSFVGAVERTQSFFA